MNLPCLEVYQKPFTSIRSEERGGGVVIYVSECLQADLVHTDENFESDLVKIGNKKAKSLFPASTVNLRETKEFIKLDGCTFFKSNHSDRSNPRN